MKNTLVKISTILLLLTVASARAEVVKVTKIPVPYTKDLKAALVATGATNFGSGLAFRGLKRAGKREFYILSDYPSEERKFTAYVGVAAVKKGSAKFKRVIPIGIKVDAEGVAPGIGDSLWIATEEPKIELLELDSKAGVILRRFSEGKELPKLLKSAQPSRGFEGVTVTSRGTVLAAVQSTLDIKNKTKDKACFIRLVEFDPEKIEYKMFAYPFDRADYVSRGEAKLGGLQSLGGNSFLVLERGEGINGAIAKVYRIDLSAATDLSGFEDESPQLEHFEDCERLFTGDKALVSPVKKELVVDLIALGWTDSKVEGLTLLEDGRTLVLSNDSDLDPSSTPLDELDSGVELWFIELSESLIGWSWREYMLFGLLALFGMVFIAFTLGLIFQRKREVI